MQRVEGVKNSSTPRFLRFSFIVVGFLLPTGADVNPSVLANQQLLAVSCLTAFLSCFMSLFLYRDRLLASTTRKFVLLAMLYLTILTLLSVTRLLPVNRYELLGLCWLGLLGFYCCEKQEAGSWFKVVFSVASLHVLSATLLGSRVLIESGAERLNNGTSPVLLGFESVLVLLSLVDLTLRRQFRCRPLMVILALASFYTLSASFSRAAFISFFVGMVVILAYSSGRLGGIKVAYGLLAVATLGLVFWPIILAFLGGADPAGVLNASGRYEIWPRLIYAADHPLRGFGFASLYDGAGPDWYLFELNNGLPAESSALEAYLMAGIWGLGAWLLLTRLALLQLWLRRRETRGTSLALGVAVLVDAVYGVGMSGVSFSWWFLLACPAFGLGARGPQESKLSSSSVPATHEMESR